MFFLPKKWSKIASFLADDPILKIPLVIPLAIEERLPCEF